MAIAVMILHGITENGDPLGLVTQVKPRLWFVGAGRPLNNVSIMPCDLY